MKIDVLGVKIDDTGLSEALEQVEKWLGASGKHYVSPEAKGKVLAKRGFYIVTPNPEFIVAANNDESFRKILNKADLAVPDGVGLKLSGKVKNTLPGIDLMQGLINLCAEKGFTTGFLGGREGVANVCAERLRRKYPKLKVVFTVSGGEVKEDGTWEAVKIPPVDVLFVAFGHGKQEKWIASNLDKIPVKVAMGVGGAFDYLSGRIPRAPSWIRSLGLEWLFRLLVEPWRIKRQLALIKYLYLLLSA